MDLGGLTHECLRQRFGFDAGMVSAKLPKEQDKKSELRWQKKKSKKFSIFADFRIIGGGILISHAVALAGLFYLYALDTDISFKPSAIISVVLGFVNMFGITAGYHRLWSHRSYEAVSCVRYFLAMLGSLAWQGSIKWWVVRHRLHHRFTDTPLDPYDSSRGLWYSHFGWLFEKPRFLERSQHLDLHDLNSDLVQLSKPVVVWNSKYYPWIVIVGGLVVPAVVGHLVYANWIVGSLFFGIFPRLISWNGIFSINSLSHAFGDHPYDEKSSATNSFFLALITNGEGNHNYHHECPKDYRHGVKWFEWDPTKWMIWTYAKLGLATHLWTTDSHLLKQTELETKVHATLDSLQSAVDVATRHVATEDFLSSDKSKMPPDTKYGMPKPDEKLPCIPSLTSLRAQVRATKAERPSAKTESEELFQVVKALLFSSKSQPPPMHGNIKCCWIQIGNHLIDATPIMEEHPGGSRLLRAMHLKDATTAFYSGANMHTKTAQRLASRLRIACFASSDEQVSRMRSQ